MLMTAQRDYTALKTRLLCSINDLSQKDDIAKNGSLAHLTEEEIAAMFLKASATEEGSDNLQLRRNFLSSSEMAMMQQSTNVGS